MSFSISSGPLTAEITTLGAELCKLVDDAGDNWLWGGDEQFWPSTAPLVFPVIGRSPSEVVSYDGLCLPMPIHGFARYSEFELVELHADQATLRLTSNAQTTEHYPFEFVMDAAFRVRASRLLTELTIKNRGDSSMPVTAGFHPGFCWPLPGCDGLDHIVSLSDSSEPLTWRQNSDGLVRREPQPTLFKNGAMTADHAHFELGAVMLTDTAQQVRFGVPNRAEVCLRSHGTANLALWSRWYAPFLCVEPWTGLPPFEGSDGALVDRPGTKMVVPGETMALSMEIELVRQ